jgi:uncharacterized SAM-binding protein YcdF (DUF218 family)
MHDMYFFLTSLFRPYPVCLLLTAAGLAHAWWRCPAARRRLWWAVVPLAVLILLSLPALAHLELGSLEWAYPPLRQPPAHVEALVILSGGMRPADATRLEAEPGEDTLDRCLSGLALYRKVGGCLVVVTGGRASDRPSDPSCAELMRDFLVGEGVRKEDVITEGRAMTTYENAVESAKLLEGRGVRRVVLVTDAAHMFRAERCFRRQGLDVVPAPCNHQATEFRWSARAFVPAVHAVSHSEYVFHEWLGTFWYWCRGRL